LAGTVARKPRVTVGAVAAVAKKPFNGKKADLKNPLGKEEDKNKAMGVTHTNSTKMFTPHHLSFQFCSKNKDRFLVLVVNIPSGVSYGGMDGRIHALVSEDQRKFMFDCVWPKVFTSPRWLVEGLRDSLTKKMGRDEVKHTMYNLVDSFTDKLQDIRGKLGVLDNEPLGGTAVFPLPFEVEKETYSTNTTLDTYTEAVTLFVVLKKKADMQVQRTYKYQIAWNIKHFR
jgi:hypothetical protein